jgi:hypothetical protein
MSTSVDTGLNQIYVPSLSAQQLSERTVVMQLWQVVLCVPHWRFVHFVSRTERPGIDRLILG